MWLLAHEFEYCGAHLISICHMLFYLAPVLSVKLYTVSVCPPQAKCCHNGECRAAFSVD